MIHMKVENREIYRTNKFKVCLGLERVWGVKGVIMKRYELSF